MLLATLLHWLLKMIHICLSFSIVSVCSCGSFCRGINRTWTTYCNTQFQNIDVAHSWSFKKAPKYYGLLTPSLFGWHLGGFFFPLLFFFFSIHSGPTVKKSLVRQLLFSNFVSCIQTLWLIGAVTRSQGVGSGLVTPSEWQRVTRWGPRERGNLQRRSWCPICPPTLHCAFWI